MIITIIIKIMLDYYFTICKVLQLKSKSNFMMLVRAELYQNIFGKTSEMGGNGVLIIMNSKRKTL